MKKQQNPKQNVQKDKPKKKASKVNKRPKTPNNTIRKTFRPQNKGASDVFLNTYANARINDVTPDRTVRSYCRMLVDPHSSPMIRRPDSSLLSSAIYHSLMELDLIVDFGVAPSSSASFGYVVQPKLGNINATADGQYKIAYLTWPTAVSLGTFDLTNPNTFATDIGGVDPRVDNNITTLTSPSPVSFFCNFGGNIGGTGYFSGFKTINTEMSKGLSPTFANNNQVKLTAGLFLIDVFVDAQSPNGAFSNGLDPTIVGGTITTTITGQNATFVRSDSGHTQWYQFSVYALGDCVITFPTTFNVAYDTYLSIVSTSTGKFSPPIDYGAIKKMRPLAMSVLTSFTSSTLNNGGNIASAVVPGDSLNDNVFINNSMKNWLNWTQLASLIGSYSGRVSEGNYTWWAPQSPADSILYSPSSSNAYTYPSIIVAGSYSTLSPTTGPVSIGRVIIDTIFEYSTTSTVFEIQPMVGSAAMVDAIQNIVHTCPRVMSNPDHLAYIAKWAKLVTKFVATNASTIGMIANGLSNLVV